MDLAKLERATALRERVEHLEACLRDVRAWEPTPAAGLDEPDGLWLGGVGGAATGRSVDLLTVGALDELKALMVLDLTSSLGQARSDFEAL